MAIKFYADTHKYVSAEGEEIIDWTSVTTLIHLFKEPFDEMAMSVACSKGKNPKYKGKTPEQIRAIWKAENTRAVTLGSWYHEQRERDVMNLNTITRDGVALRIINPLMEGVVKLAPPQKISEGIYPEHLIYLKSVGVCGQADRVEVVNNKINLYDYKTNKEIKQEGFKNRNGVTKKMLPPLSHLDDCNFNDYALQLSIYMFMMLKHNPMLEFGKMEIHHIQFGVVAYDENGYPITELDPNGEPLVRSVTPYEVPYLKNEVVSLLKYFNANKQNLLNVH